MKAISLYLDDERNPKTDRNWVIVRSYEEFKDYIYKNGIPDYISFDHDLGSDSKSGYEAAKWMEIAVLYGLVHWNPNFKFNVHSANPIGAKNIEVRLNNFIKFMEGNS